MQKTKLNVPVFGTIIPADSSKYPLKVRPKYTDITGLQTDDSDSQAVFTADALPRVVARRRAARPHSQLEIGSNELLLSESVVVR